MSLSAAVPAAAGLQVCWQIGGLTVQLSSADAALTLTAPPALTQFAADPAPAAAQIEARWGSTEAEAGLRADFESGGVWTLTRSGQEFVFAFRSPAFGTLPYKIARFDRQFSAGEIVLHRPYFRGASAVNPLEYPLDELLFTNLLALGGGVEMHACGVVDGGRGLLFPGFSGAGKSTMARLWHRREGATVLSDDRIVLRTDGSRVLMYGTPWHGDAALIDPGPVPLARILVLRQARQPGVRRLAAAAAVASLFARAFPPFHCPERLAATLATLDEIVRLAPCDELSFTRDAATVDYVRRLV